MNTKKALVLGITGGIGSEVALALLRRGWHVKALHRNPAGASVPEEVRANIEWVTGDAMNRDDVIAAANGVSTIVHAVNPPKYHNWGGLVLPMLENTIAAAREQRARVVLPGTIYNFGLEAFPVLSEYSPQNPGTRKGRIRVEMEKRLRDATTDGVRTLIVRAGDYFGPHAGNNWFNAGLLGGSQKVRRVLYPGPRNLGHSWAYLPDLAETMARLLEVEASLEDFAVFHFRGHWLERGVEMAETILRVAGRRGGRIFAFPWWAIRLAAPFVEMCREMLEMRYLWGVAAELDNTKLLSVIGTEPRTELEVAVRRALGTRSPQSPGG